MGTVYPIKIVHLAEKNKSSTVHGLFFSSFTGTIWDVSMEIGVVRRETIGESSRFTIDTSPPTQQPLHAVNVSILKSKDDWSIDHPTRDPRMSHGKWRKLSIIGKKISRVGSYIAQKKGCLAWGRYAFVSLRGNTYTCRMEKRQTKTARGKEETQGGWSQWEVSGRVCRDN